MMLNGPDGTQFYVDGGELVARMMSAAFQVPKLEPASLDWNSDPVLGMQRAAMAAVDYLVTCMNEAKVH